MKKTLLIVTTCLTTLANFAQESQADNALDKNGQVKEWADKMRAQRLAREAALKNAAAFTETGDEAEEQAKPEVDPDPEDPKLKALKEQYRKALDQRQYAENELNNPRLNEQYNEAASVWSALQIVRNNRVTGGRIVNGERILSQPGDFYGMIHALQYGTKRGSKRAPKALERALKKAEKWEMTPEHVNERIQKSLDKINEVNLRLQDRWREGYWGRDAFNRTAYEGSKIFNEQFNALRFNDMIFEWNTQLFANIHDAALKTMRNIENRDDHIREEVLPKVDELLYLLEQEILKIDPDFNFDTDLEPEKSKTLPQKKSYQDEVHEYNMKHNKGYRERYEASQLEKSGKKVGAVDLEGQGEGIGTELAALHYDLFWYPGKYRSALASNALQDHRDAQKEILEFSRALESIAKLTELYEEITGFGLEDTVGQPKKKPSEQFKNA